LANDYIRQAQLKVKKLETAVQNRKRSSRLAIKESIVEAQRQEDEKRAAELELHARARRQEERQRRQEEDMLKREREREERVRSREARAERRIEWDGSESGVSYHHLSTFTLTHIDIERITRPYSRGLVGSPGQDPP
jgi:hypothetical protein